MLHLDRHSLSQTTFQQLLLCQHILGCTFIIEGRVSWDSLGDTLQHRCIRSAWRHLLSDLCNANSHRLLHPCGCSSKNTFYGHTQLPQTTKQQRCEKIVVWFRIFSQFLGEWPARPLVTFYTQCCVTEHRQVLHLQHLRAPKAQGHTVTHRQTLAVSTIDCRNKWTKWLLRHPLTTTNLPVPLCCTIWRQRLRTWEVSERVICPWFIQ